MSADLEEQRHALERELVRVERQLEADAVWRALSALDGTAGASSDPEILAARAELVARLARNRLYQVRTRLLEAIALLAETDQGDGLATEPGSAGAAAPGGESSPLPRGADEGAAAPAFTILAARPEPASSEGFRTRTRIKVRIRPQPPEAERVEPADARREPDRLTDIRGIDSAIAARLHSLGIRHFSQIRNWSTHDVRAVSAALRLDRQIARENWIEQAALLDERRKASAAQTRPPAQAVNNELHEPSPEAIAGEQIAVSLAPLKPPLLSGLPPRDVRVEVEEVLARLASSVPCAEPSSMALPASAPSAEASAEPPFYKLIEPLPPDDLTLIRGLSPEIAARLAELGVTRFSDVCEFRPEDVSELSLDPVIGRRISADQWIEQAAVLSRGGRTGFSHASQNGPLLPRTVAPPSPLEARPRDREALDAAALTRRPPPPAMPRPVPYPDPPLAAQDWHRQRLDADAGTPPLPRPEPVPYPPSPLAPDIWHRLRLDAAAGTLALAPSPVPPTAEPPIPNPTAPLAEIEEPAALPARPEASSPPAAASPPLSGTVAPPAFPEPVAYPPSPLKADPELRRALNAQRQRPRSLSQAISEIGVPGDVGAPQGPASASAAAGGLPADNVAEGHDTGDELSDHELRRLGVFAEEAEVSIVAPSPSARVRDQSGREEAEEEATMIWDKPELKPGSLKSRLQQADQADPLDGRHYAAYREQIDEAAVDIVDAATRRRHRLGSAESAGPGADKSADASAETGEAGKVSRFLRALTGRE